MRIRASDAGGQRSSRRLGRGADPASDRDTADRTASGRDAGRRHSARNHAGNGRDDSSGSAGSRARADAARRGEGPAGSPDTGRGGASAAGSELFAPGFDGTGPGRDTGPGRARAPGSSSYGSTAGGAAGKGPVRGYPPAPGQPPPMYPPGQFAAWNHRQESRPAPGSQPGPDRGQPGRGQPGRGPGGRPRRDAGQPVQAGRQSPETDSGYYDRSGAEPGYSVLAVSDPAADVTSTQTWQAVGDGRSTGTWTAPARPGPGSGGQDASSGAQRSSPRATSGRHSAPPGAAWPDTVSTGDAWPSAAWPEAPDTSVGDGVWPATPSPDTLRPDPAWPPSGPQRAGSESASFGRAAPDGEGPELTRLDRASQDSASQDRARLDSASQDRASQDGEQRRGRGHSGRSNSGPPAAGGKRSAGPGGPAGGSRPAGSKRPGRRKRPASVKLAMSVALLLVLTAAATLAYTVLHRPPKPQPLSAAADTNPEATASASASPSLGNGHIGSRQSDPQPLTVAQLFPASFTVSGNVITRAASSISRHCSRALTGSSIQSAVSSAHCDQAVRATYLARSQGLMGTVGVLNLSTAARAAKAVKAADASDYISQLTGRRGPTRRIGNGTGIEEALAKGHYLILIWAEFTNLRKPRTALQRTRVESFMTDLLNNTANVSLTTRMLTGTP